MQVSDGPRAKASRRGRPLSDAEADLVDRYSLSLRAFFQEVSAVLTELDRDLPQLTVSMKKHPEQILSMLPRVLPFEQMSLLEIQYVLAGTSRRRPGIRFWLEGPLREKRLRAILFQDTRIWDVSYELERLYTELGSFLLRDGEIVAHPAAALSGKLAAGSDWRVLLRAVLRAPLSCPDSGHPGSVGQERPMEHDGGNDA